MLYMLSQNFSERAVECMRLAARSRSEHDRALFMAMARAWRGASNEADDARDASVRLR